MIESEGEGMSEKSEAHYPVESIHNFLLEVEKELRRLRIASLIGMIALVLILLSLIRFAVRLIESAPPPSPPPRPLMGLAIDTIILALAALSVCYSAYALYRQNRFFRRWGRRFELLREVEQKLLG